MKGQKRNKSLQQFMFSPLFIENRVSNPSHWLKYILFLILRMSYHHWRQNKTQKSSRQQMLHVNPDFCHAQIKRRFNSFSACLKPITQYTVKEKKNFSLHKLSIAMLMDSKSDIEINYGYHDHYQSTESFHCIKLFHTRGTSATKGNALTIDKGICCWNFWKYVCN